MDSVASETQRGRAQAAPPALCSGRHSGGREPRLFAQPPPAASPWRRHAACAAIHSQRPLGGNRLTTRRREGDADQVLGTHRLSWSTIHRRSCIPRQRCGLSAWEGGGLALKQQKGTGGKTAPTAGGGLTSIRVIVSISDSHLRVPFPFLRPPRRSPHRRAHRLRPQSPRFLRRGRTPVRHLRPQAVYPAAGRRQIATEQGPKCPEPHPECSYLGKAAGEPTAGEPRSHVSSRPPLQGAPTAPARRGEGAERGSGQS